MTQRTIDEYILPLGRIRHEQLSARPRPGTLYVLTDLPPGILGYTIPDREPYVQRTIDDYRNPRERRLWYDEYRELLPGRKDLRAGAYQSEQIKTEADSAALEKKR